MGLHKFFAATILGTVLFVSGTANAAFIDRDYASLNDNLLTFDNLTGLEWLDITVAKGLTGGQAITQFSEFRLANRNEVQQLLTNAGFTRLNPGRFNYDFADAPAAELLFSHFGITFDTGFEQILTGHIVDPFGDLDSYSIRNHQTNGATNSFINLDNSILSSNSDTGFFLVRTSTVPIPSTILLMFFGLIGIIGLVKRKKA